MDNQRKSRRIALAGTIIVHAIILVVLCFTVLSYQPKEEERNEILFGGEFVMIGDNSLQNTSDRPSPIEQTAIPDTHNPSATIMSEQESPMKISDAEQPEKELPSQEEIARQEEEKKRKETANRINNRVKFNNSDNGSKSGGSGSPEGNSTTGTANGTPGYNLKGRTAEKWGTPKSRSLSGKITIRVRVNRQGEVTSAEYAGGEGPAAANESMRQSCIRASLDSRFSVDMNAPTEQTGTITWRFVE